MNVNICVPQGRLEGSGVLLHPITKDHTPRQIIHHGIAVIPSSRAST